MNPIDKSNKHKADRLQVLLKEYGINTVEELDEALRKSIAGMTLGIMTDEILKKVNTA